MVPVWHRPQASAGAGLRVPAGWELHREPRAQHSLGSPLERPQLSPGLPVSRRHTEGLRGNAILPLACTARSQDASY